MKPITGNIAANVRWARREGLGHYSIGPLLKGRTYPTASTWRKIESGPVDGKPMAVTEGTAAAILDVLGVPQWYLLEEDPESFQAGWHGRIDIERTSKDRDLARASYNQNRDRRFRNGLAIWSASLVVATALVGWWAYTLAQMPQ